MNKKNDRKWYNLFNPITILSNVMKKVFYKTNQNNPAVRAYKEAVENGKKNQHVLPRGNEWVVKRADSERAQVFGTQQEATSYAESIAQNQGTTVFVHGVDGRIRDTINN